MKQLGKKIITLIYLSTILFSLFIPFNQTFAQYVPNSLEISVNKAANQETGKINLKTEETVTVTAKLLGKTIGGEMIYFSLTGNESAFFPKTCTISTISPSTCSVKFKSLIEGTFPLSASVIIENNTYLSKDVLVEVKGCSDPNQILVEGKCTTPTNITPSPTPPATATTNTIYDPLAKLPGLESPIDTAGECPFGRYLNIMIKLILGIAAVLAMVMIVMGGIEYMTSELISGKEAGKETVTHAILGLLIALGAYLILNTINPQLLSVCLDTLPKATIEIDPETETAPQTGYYQVTGNTENCKEGYTDITVSTPGNPSKINICKSISSNLGNMLTRAKEKGIILSGSGSRSYDTQVNLRREHGCPDIYNSPSSACHPPTARPGHSMHESGKAIDFNCNGQSMRDSSCFAWLRTNAGFYGFQNLSSEPWHWSINGH